MPILFVAILLSVMSGHALAGNGFFYGGMAEGMRDAQELELQQRALDQDRLYGTNSYSRVQQQIEMQRLRRGIEENNRLLKEQQWRQMNR